MRVEGVGKGFGGEVVVGGDGDISHEGGGGTGGDGSRGEVVMLLEPRERRGVGDDGEGASDGGGVASRGVEARRAVEGARDFGVEAEGVDHRCGSLESGEKALDKGGSRGRGATRRGNGAGARNGSAPVGVVGAGAQADVEALGRVEAMERRRGEDLEGVLPGVDGEGGEVDGEAPGGDGALGGRGGVQVVGVEVEIRVKFLAGEEAWPGGADDVAAVVAQAQGDEHGHPIDGGGTSGGVEVEVGASGGVGEALRVGGEEHLAREVLAREFDRRDVHRDVGSRSREDARHRHGARSDGVEAPVAHIEAARGATAGDDDIVAVGDDREGVNTHICNGLRAGAAEDVEGGAVAVDVEAGGAVGGGAEGGWDVSAGCLLHGQRGGFEDMLARGGAEVVAGGDGEVTLGLSREREQGVVVIFHNKIKVFDDR